ncbi:MAG: hypothetical protein O7H40_14120 [Gammaproteobacteria bacterium]|nr:hypothetical protein [Gammaproteobacteria bacterium]
MTKKKALGGWFTCALLIALVFVNGCSNQYAEETRRQKQTVTAKLSALGSKINAGELANILLIANYADKLAQSKPDLEPVAGALRQDATTSGPLYQGLKERLAAVKDEPANKNEFLPIIGELDSLNAATDPTIFNDSLIDVVNTLADLSGGELARINIPQNALAANVQGNPVAGSYLVGNPSYGRWNSDSGGRSFWVFYGQYRLFSDILFGRGYHRGPLYYNSWYGGANRYSYYNDYGRSTYGRAGDRGFTRARRSDMRSKGLTSPTPAKRYGSAAGNKRVSTYAAARTNRAQGASKRRSSLFGSSSRRARAGGK